MQASDSLYASQTDVLRSRTVRKEAAIVPPSALHGSAVFAWWHEQVGSRSFKPRLESPRARIEDTAKGKMHGGAGVRSGRRARWESALSMSPTWQLSAFRLQSRTSHAYGRSDAVVHERASLHVCCLCAPSVSASSAMP